MVLVGPKGASVEAASSEEEISEERVERNSRTQVLKRRAKMAAEIEDSGVVEPR